MQHVFARLHVGVGNFDPAHGGVFEDAFVDELLDIGDLRSGERAAVEVEGQLVRTDVGTFLRRILADDIVQRPMKKMRDGVVALDGEAARLVNAKNELVADGRDALALDEMKPSVAGLLRVRDL